MFCAVKLGYIHWNYGLGWKIALNVNEAAEETAGESVGKRTPPEGPEEYHEGLQLLLKQNPNGLVVIFNSAASSRSGEDRVITGNAAENNFRLA